MKREIEELEKELAGVRGKNEIIEKQNRLIRSMIKEKRHAAMKAMLDQDG